jgi:hypothetical protein
LRSLKNILSLIGSASFMSVASHRCWQTNIMLQLRGGDLFPILREN